jgi:hypothetical protein
MGSSRREYSDSLYIRTIEELPIVRKTTSDAAKICEATELVGVDVRGGSQLNIRETSQGGQMPFPGYSAAADNAESKTFICIHPYSPSRIPRLEKSIASFRK